MIDSFGRKINYLRISVTDLCNLRCQYCMPEKGVCKVEHDEVLALEEIYKIAEVFISLGIDKIRLTGGEPLVRKGIVKLIADISNLGKVKDLAMTTNGVLLKKYAKDLKNAGLNRVNISLDTLNEDKYSEITRGGKLKDVLDGIEEAKVVGLLPIKLNVVLVGGFNVNEIKKFVYLTEKENIDVRFIELMPIGEAANWQVDKFTPNQVILDEVKELEKIENTDPSSPAIYYKLSNGKGKVGIINPISHKFCGDCNRIRLTAQGKLKLCLHSNDEIDLKEVLRSGGDIEKVIKESITYKPQEHHLEDGKYIEKNMFQIGG